MTQGRSDLVSYGEKQHNWDHAETHENLLC